MEAEDFPSSVLPHSHILGAPFSAVLQPQFSRYFHEFEELQLLGKGAFGAVIKVHKVTFTFRAFNRRFYPKRLTISTFVCVLFGSVSMIIKRVKHGSAGG